MCVCIYIKENANKPILVKVQKEKRKKIVRKNSKKKKKSNSTYKTEKIKNK